MFIAAGLQAMLNIVMHGDLQRKFVTSQKNLHLQTVATYVLKNSYANILDECHGEQGSLVHKSSKRWSFSCKIQP